MTVDVRQHETVELLQATIRNQCVNTGAVDSGAEIRNSDLIESYLEGSGLDFARVEPSPGRRSLITEIEGTDPTAPTLCLLGHTDVVPVNASGLAPRPVRWRADRRRGVGSRCARHAEPDVLDGRCHEELARSGKRPKGTIRYMRRRRRGSRRPLRRTASRRSRTRPQPVRLPDH